MTVLSPEEAKKFLDELAATPPKACELCLTPFSETIKPERTTIGPFPAWFCAECSKRHAAFKGAP